MKTPTNHAHDRQVLGHISAPDPFDVIRRRTEWCRILDDMRADLETETT